RSGTGTKSLSAGPSGLGAPEKPRGSSTTAGGAGGGVGAAAGAGAGGGVGTGVGVGASGALAAARAAAAPPRAAKTRRAIAAARARAITGPGRDDLPLRRVPPKKLPGIGPGNSSRLPSPSQAARLTSTAEGSSVIRGSQPIPKNARSRADSPRRV